MALSTVYRLVAAGVAVPAVLAALSGCAGAPGDSAPATVTVTEHSAHSAGSVPGPPPSQPADAPGDPGSGGPCADISTGDLIRRQALDIPDRTASDRDWFVAEDTIQPCGGAGYARINRFSTIPGSELDPWKPPEERILFFNGAEFAGITPPADSYSITNQPGSETAFTVYTSAACTDVAAGAQYRATVTADGFSFDPVNLALDCDNMLLVAPSGDPADIAAVASPRFNPLATYRRDGFPFPVEDEDFSGNDIGPTVFFPDAPTEQYFRDPQQKVACHTRGEDGGALPTSSLECRLVDPLSAAPAPERAYSPADSFCADDAPIYGFATDLGNPDAVEIIGLGIACPYNWPDRSGSSPDGYPHDYTVLGPGQRIRTGAGYLCTGGSDAISCVRGGYGFTIGPDTVDVWSPKDTY
ncbi:hypothetical protein ACFSSC_04725 [Corynebacterium mendelii]|uniref:Uncharacterized protein n=1 Tax=Corynebacterium mendelii TaxID=2765362 RepID=A0A939IUK5_9CORY|nr:hypothetical protein [Corynebacterium mendelii]MBN9643296.1 hypothetical protein [Corynebacterium mendelii]